MLLRIGVDDHSLSEAYPDTAIMYAAHENALRALIQHGILVARGRENELIPSIFRTDQAAKTLWLTAWQGIYKQVAPRTLSPIGTPCTLDELAATWRAHADVIFACDACAQQFGVGVGPSITHGASGLEVVRFRLAQSSQVLRDTVALSNAPLVIGDSRRDFWDERFQRLAERARTVVICDRFAAKRLVDHILRFDAAHPDRGSGLAWLIRSINDVAGCLSDLNIYVPDPPPQVTKQQVIDAIARTVIGLSARAIANVTAIFTRSPIFMAHAHHRHIRFDNHAYTMDIGVEAIDSSTFTRVSTFCPIEYAFAIETERNLDAAATDRRSF